MQEAKLSQWPPEAHIEPQNHLLGLPPRAQNIQRILNIEGTFQDLRSCKSLDLELDAQAFDVQRVLRAQKQTLALAR